MKISSFFPRFLKARLWFFIIQSHFFGNSWIKEGSYLFTSPWTATIFWLLNHKHHLIHRIQMPPKLQSDVLRNLQWQKIQPILWTLVCRAHSKANPHLLRLEKSTILLKLKLKLELSACWCCFLLVQILIDAF